MNTTSTLIHRRMQQRELTVHGLAATTGIARMTLTRRLQDPKTFTVRELELVAEALDTTLFALITGDGS